MTEKISEHSAQASVISWAKNNESKYPPLRWLFAIPNGAKLPYMRGRGGARFAPQALKLLSEGLKPGVSDLFLPYPNGIFCGLFIEMKVGSNKPTDQQAAFMRDMNEVGYLSVVCWTADHAISTIESYLQESKRWMTLSLSKDGKAKA